MALNSPSLIDYPLAGQPSAVWDIPQRDDVYDIYNSIHILARRGVLNDIIDVTDWGFVKDGTADNYAAMVNLVALFPGRAYYFPQGIYIFSNFPTLTTSATKIFGDGKGLTRFVNTKAGGDFIVFQPALPLSGTLINFVALEGIDISRAVAPVGATPAVKFVQCNTYSCFEVAVYDHPNGIEVHGGQSGTFRGINVQISALLGGVPIANSSLFRIENAPLTAGVQQVFTSSLSEFTFSGNGIIDANILIQGVDGFNISDGYNAHAYDDLVRIQPSVSGVHCSVVCFSNVYNDGINPATGSLNGINFANDGFAGASIINDIVVDANTKFANIQTNGLVCNHLQVQGCSICEESFLNITGAPLNITASYTGFYGLPIPWTPVLTFATQGDLAVGYNKQFGMLLQKNGVCVLTFDVITDGAGMVYTTSLGQLYINGNPIINNATANYSAVGSLVFSGINKAGGYTQANIQFFAGGTTMVVNCSGMGVAEAYVDVVDIPSGSYVSLKGTISFHLEPRN